MLQYDIVVIGGGPAGIAAAISAKKQGVNKVLLIDKEDELGGVLNQCIGSGYGINIFNKELTGTEYIQKFIDELEVLQIEYKVDTMVLNISNDKVITLVNGESGIIKVKTKVIIMATGCREKPRGIINIPGNVVAGIYTAGTVQRFVNIDGYLPGKKIVVLGSGNIALLTAKRMILEGADVMSIVEAKTQPDADEENIIECKEYFNIPIKLGYTLKNIIGKDRVEGVTIVKIDDNKAYIEGTEEYIECDTIMLSAELFPENELAIKLGVDIHALTGGIHVNEYMRTNVEWVFACGDCLYVHENVDYIVEESYKVGSNVAQFINSI